METQIKRSDRVEEVAPGLARLRILFANVYLYGTPDSWVLIDAGLPGAGNHIIQVAEERFGEGRRPEDRSCFWRSFSGSSGSFR